jgi:RHS repeat-associated protein
MAGISSKAAGVIENKYRYNDGSELASQEFTDGSGLNWYETMFRSSDPQTGRFNQVDPLGALTEDVSGYAYANNNPSNFNDPYGLTAQAYKGYVHNPLDGTINYDPNVNSQDDLDPNSGLVYLGDRIKVTQNDVTTWWDENGNSTTTNPNWNILPNVAVSNKPKKNNNAIGTVGNFVERAAHNVASSMIFVSTAVGSSVYNGLNDLVHNGPQEGDDFRYFTGRTFKLENWKLKVVIDPQKGKYTMTDDESNELAMSSVNVAMMPVQVVPGVNVSKSVIVNGTINWARNTAVKEAVKAPIKVVLGQ